MIFPKQGDVVVVDAEPHAGHEMGGHNPRSGNIRRHYVVVSSTAYNSATHMFVGMPITTTNRSGNARYLPLLINGSKRDGVKGYVVLWQLQNFDYEARRGEVVNSVSPAVLNRLLTQVKDIFDIN